MYTLAPAQIALFVSVAALLLMAITTVVQRDVRRSALIASGVVLELSVHGHLVPWHGLASLLAAGVLIALLVVLGAALPARTMRPITHLINAVAVALAAANLVVIITERPPSPDALLVRSIDAEPRGSGPDVWYIAPDRYPDLDVLEELGLDTGPFRDELLRRGFALVDDARANYPATQVSLASAWSAEYLDLPATGSPTTYAVELLKDPPIGRAFVDAGYSYLHLGTWLDATASSDSATAVLTLQIGAEFARAFEEHTLLPVVREITNGRRELLANVLQRQILHGRHQLDLLRSLAAREPAGSEFVLAHITLPHPPYVFDHHGELRTSGVTKAEAYERQLAFVNGQLLDIVDLLQAREDPPLIVLLPDEGIYPEDLDDAIDKEDYDLFDLPPDQIRNKLSITAAAFAPETTDPFAFPEGTTAVNVVRAMLNRALGKDLAPLPDQSFMWTTTDRGERILAPADP